MTSCCFTQTSGTLKLNGVMTSDDRIDINGGSVLVGTEFSEFIVTNGVYNSGTITFVSGAPRLPHWQPGALGAPGSLERLT